MMAVKMTEVTELHHNPLIFQRLQPSFLLLTFPACFSPVRAVTWMPGCSAVRRTTSAPV